MAWIDDIAALNSSLGSFAGQLASASLSAASSKKLQNQLFDQQKYLNEEQFHRQEYLMNLQHNLNTADYERTLADTSPASQVKRYKEAGLSDAAAVMAAGDIQPQFGNNTALSAQGGSAPVMPTPPNINLDVLGALRQYMALRKEKVEAENVESTQMSDILGILDKNDAYRVANMLAMEDLRFKIQTNPYSANSMYYHSVADSILPDAQKVALEQARSNLALARQQYGFLEKYHNEQFKEIQEKINLLIKEQAKTEQETATSKAQQGLLSEQSGKVHEETKGVQLSNYGKVVENALNLFGMPNDPVQKIGALVASGELPVEKVGSYLRHCRDYAVDAYNTFRDDDPTLQSVFTHSLVPSIGESDKTPVWSHGSVTRPVRDILNTISRYRDR